MLTAVLVALGLGLGLQPFAIRLLRRRGVLDHPSARSSHVAPTPRGGGVVVVLALVLGAAAGGALDEPGAVVVLVVTVSCALVGLAEDVRGIPVLQRLGLLLLACAPLALPARAGSSGHLLLALLAVAFAVAVVNAFNFMDGINGISAAQGLVAGTAYTALAALHDLDGTAALAAAVAAASLSFAPFNLPLARVFLGDAGSYGLGAVLAGLAVVLLAHGVPPEAVLGPLALTLADTGTTLARRYRDGEEWHLPHRTHVYQRLTDTGASHVRVTSVVLALTALCAAAGCSTLLGQPWRVLGDVVILGAVGGYLRLPAVLARSGAPA